MGRNEPADWHWPDLSEARCDTRDATDDRDRLGLPNRYVASPLAAALARATAELRGASVDALLKILADGHHTLSQRLAAGDLLAIAGDPRLRADEPHMIAIEGRTAEIGLPADKVGAVMQRYTGLALQRPWIEKECPRHPVAVGAFRLARYPVTNQEYREFLLATGHAELPGSWSFRQFPVARGNHPVYTVSAASADAYAAWLAARTGRGFRLPTEAEWETAAAGPEGREFPWGEWFEPGLCNTAETGLFRSSAVGAFAGGESAEGVADLAGNVEEYVADDYRPYPGGAAVVDHLANHHAHGYRVARGGSFARFRDLARTRRRHGQNPLSATHAMGFRLAETP
jgi:toxoflavin biosynthesis protein ToxD